MTVYQQATASGRQFWQGQIPASTVASPTTAPTLLPTGSGATLNTTVAYVKYTWVTAAGETLPSPEATVNTISNGQSLLVTIPALPAGVTKANIYISTAAGTETLQGSTTTTTFTQSTPLAAGVAVPTTNTAGATVLYTAPPYSSYVTSAVAGTSVNTGSAGSSTAYVKSIVATNTTSAPVTLTLYIVPGTSTTTNGVTTITAGTASMANAYQFYSTTIPANNSIVLSELDDMMPANSSLQAIAGVANAITLTVSGVEVQ